MCTLLVTGGVGIVGWIGERHTPQHIQHSTNNTYITYGTNNNIYIDSRPIENFWENRMTLGSFLFFGFYAIMREPKVARHIYLFKQGEFIYATRF